MHLGVKIYPQAYLEFYVAQKQSSNGYTHVSEVQLFNGVVDDITGSRVIREIDMAAFHIHIGRNTISAHTTARNTSPMAVTMLYNTIIYYIL